MPLPIVIRSNVSKGMHKNCRKYSMVLNKILKKVVDDQVDRKFLLCTEIKAIS